MEEPNFSYLSSFSGGNKVFELKILKFIKIPFPVEVDTYLNNIGHNNYKYAANNVHKLKHKISFLGLEKSYVIATQHELNLLVGDSNLQENLNEIVSSITRFLNEL